MATRDDLSDRQLARRKVKQAGDRSSRVSRELMLAQEAVLAKLELDPELAAAIKAARAVKSMTARRRAERALAGELRRIDIPDLEKRLAAVRATGTVDSERLRLAERIREKLLAEGSEAATDVLGGDPDHELPGMIAQARRERDTGKPAGAGRVLFRHLVDILRARDEVAQDDDADDDGDADDEE